MDKKILTVAKREFLERVRTRWFLVATLAVPVLMSGAFLVPLYLTSKGSASSNVRHIAILDATGVGLGDRVAKALMADSTLRAPGADSIQPRVVVVSPTDLAAKEAAATSEVKKPKHIVGYLVLSDSTLAGRVARYAGRNASTISDMEKLTTILRQEVMMVRLEREGVKEGIVDELAKTRLRVSSERLSERGRSGSGAAGIFGGIMVGVMLLMSILIHGQNILRGVLEEKSTRVAEVVISSVKPETLLAGKVLGVGAVGLTQQVAWIAISSYLINFLMPIVMKGTNVAANAAASGGGGFTSAFGSLSFGMLGIALAYFLVGFVFYATLYAAAGSMVNSEQEAQQAAMPIMVLIMSAWLLVNVVMVNPNGQLAVVLSWLPWASPIIMPIRIGLTTVSPLSIAASMLIAILGSVGAVWLSARIYRVGMLMYGKKPTVGEIMKWIRYA
jgi:ABC-2 type transport system permease protein